MLRIVLERQQLGKQLTGKKIELDLQTFYRQALITVTFLLCVNISRSVTVCSPCSIQP